MPAGSRIMKQLLIVLSLLLIWAAAPAQETTPAPKEPASQEAVPDTQSPDQDTVSVDEEDIPVDEDSSANPPPPSSRFEPTEQISEDLSVSFPIDI